MFRKIKATRVLGLMVIAILVLSLSLAGCNSAAPAAQGTPDGPEPVSLTMFIWAGAGQGVVPQEVVEEYLVDNPHVTIEFLESNNATVYPMMLAAKETTPDQPIVNLGFFNVSIICRGEFDEMWVPLDPENIPNMNLIDRNYWRPGNRGIGFVDTPIGLMYNVNSPIVPTSWTDLWSDEFAGRVALWDYNWFAPGMASRLHGGSEVDMEPGFRLWEERAGNLHSLFTSNDQLRNLIDSGDIWVAPWFSSITTVWMEEGSPLGWIVPEEGVIAFPAYLAIAQGSTPEQIAVAEDLINIMLEPKWNARYAELTNNLPLTEGAAELLPQEFMDRPYLSDRLDLIFFDWDGMSPFESEWRDAWDRRIKPGM